MSNDQVKKKTIFHSLNKFFPVFFLYVVLGIAPFGGLAVYGLLHMFDIDERTSQTILNYAFPLMIVFFFPVLFHIWNKTDMYAFPITGNENDWRRGHTVLAVGNAVFLLPTLYEAMYSLIRGEQFYWFSMFAGIISIPLWLAGWGMIKRSASWNLPRI